VLINATSVGMDPRQSFDLFDDTVHFTNTVVLDMASRNKDSILKKRVEKSLGIYISGVDMFQRLTILGFRETCKQLHLSVV
jgi:shikimate 5-dehydrogenase